MQEEEVIGEELVEEGLSDLDPSECLHIFHHKLGCQPSALLKGHSSL